MVDGLVVVNGLVAGAVVGEMVTDAMAGDQCSGPARWMVVGSWWAGFLVAASRWLVAGGCWAVVGDRWACEAVTGGAVACSDISERLLLVCGQLYIWLAGWSVAQCPPWPYLQWSEAARCPMSPRICSGVWLHGRRLAAQCGPEATAATTHP